ncbi:MAG: Uma2 family endonuclease [Synechococcales cyanobacterium CRU_2_2]|nr:Uma2 family endonuclease [Synechococcales cyanobacterium CRU_2_2]
MTILTRSLTLEAFLQQPETDPPSEYIDGQISPKPMPKGRHSRLQGKLGGAINASAEELRLAYAFPELRCNFGGRSIIPDLAIFDWNRIPRTPTGTVPDDFDLAPDWIIEILSPKQQTNKVLDNILHCLQHGCQLGWFLEPDDESILLLLPEQAPRLYRGNTTLPVFLNLRLELSPAQIFGWLAL